MLEKKIMLRNITDQQFPFNISGVFCIFSGNLYHKGEHSNTLPSFTQGDYLTCILDVDNKTLSFGKNGEEPILAFQDVDATELFPCVLFYSTNPGEKVCFPC